MIKLEKISKRFGTHVILDQIDLELKESEILSVIGKSGTGKSVLLKIIIGLLKPDNGRIFVDGEDITGYNEYELDNRVRNKVSMVFQQGALWDSMTIGQNIGLALRIHKHLNEEERKKRIMKSLDMVGLSSSVLEQYPEELSGGMIKRVSIARAIVTYPKYIFYDEPTTGLDPVSANLINKLIIDLNKEMNMTTLVISHDIKGVEQISDRVAMLYNAHIIVNCDAGMMWQQKNPIFINFIHGKVETL